MGGSSRRFLLISSLGKYDRETVGRGWIVYIPLAELWQRPTFILLPATNAFKFLNRL